MEGGYDNVRLGNARNAVGGGPMPATATQSERSTIISALNEQDRMLSQLWEVVKMLEDKLHPVLTPLSADVVKAGAPTPIPERAIERIGMNNSNIGNVTQSLDRLTGRLAL